MRRMRGFFNGWVVTLLFTATLGYFAVRHWPSQKPLKSEAVPETPAEMAPLPEAKEGEEAAAKPAKGVRRDTASDSKPASKEMDEAPSDTSAPLSTALSRSGKGATRSFCQSVEFRGGGPDGGQGGQWGRISSEQWRKVMTQFHFAKKDLLGWLDEHRFQFTKEVSDHMEEEVRELRLQRPPTPDYPDLAFRGIGLWTRPQGERPIIKLGGGFAKLVERHPARGRFELTRLIAQTWSPCELRRSPIAAHLPSEGPWNALLSCLGVQDENACAPGSFSEAGWAVSSALAAVASPPGCTVPAFASGAGEGCLKDVESVGSRLPASRMTRQQPRSKEDE